MKKLIKSVSMSLALAAVVLTIPATSTYASTGSTVSTFKTALASTASTPKASEASILKTSLASTGSTYQVNLERGIKYLCYSKDDVVWTTDSSSITNYEGEQTRSGLFVELKGISKKSSLSSSTKYALLCKHTFLVGAVISGVTLGYNTDVNDMLYIYKNGTSDVKWDY